MEGLGMPGHFHLSGGKLRTDLNAETVGFICQGETGGNYPE